MKNLFLTTRLYLSFGTCSALFFTAFFLPWLMTPVQMLTAGICILILVDLVLLFFTRSKIKGERIMNARFSLGDDNKVRLAIRNDYQFKTWIKLIDELPIQFQDRSWFRKLSVPYKSKSSIEYSLRPVTRGEYEFGNLVAYVKTPLGLLQRRFYAAGPQVVKVYPSYVQLRRYQLMASSDNLNYGSKKVRRLGHSMEFEKIKDYVQGDDVRTINWKATARRGDLMVNTYTDARQQQIYCLVDKGRAMKMPFDGMTLLGYSINAALALLNIALLRDDKAGLITFSQKVNDVIPAERRSAQMHLILETLYKQQTDFLEPDYEALWQTVSRKVTQRSLLLLFTNFETMGSLQRQLPYLRRMAAQHLVCVVFFRNTLLKDIQEKQPDTIEGIYVKTIAERFDYEKRMIVKELRRHGILSILTTPREMSVDVINKYLEMKARQLI